jgi:carbon storage regulator
MLVLSRKVNQEILIGDGIKVVVLAVRGRKVTLGFEAPTNTPIQRTELLSKEVPSSEVPDETAEGLKSP